MFENVEVYSGGIVPVEPEAKIAPLQDEREPIVYEKPSGHRPDIVLREANLEAERLIAEAREEAEAIKRAILEEARLEREKVVASHICSSLSELDTNLWESRSAIVSVVENALKQMVGHIGKPDVIIHAVETAARRYARGHTATVYAEKATADRLKLVMMSKTTRSGAPLLLIEENDALEPGRCVLDTGQKRFEISVDAQIHAIKQSCAGAVAELSDTEVIGAMA